MGDLSEHFDAKEFACQCGCGYGTRPGDVNPRLLIVCEAIRKMLGSKPLIVLSGCRCPTHNEAVGGERNSAHLRGCAADLKIDGGNRKFTATRVAMYSGAIGIGVYPWGLHIDVDTSLPRPAIWPPPPLTAS